MPWTSHSAGKFLPDSTCLTEAITRLIITLRLNRTNKEPEREVANMADVPSTLGKVETASTVSQSIEKQEKNPLPRREIPGNLPYMSAPGSLKRVLDKIIEAQRPDKFTVDFLENVLKMTGGSARATIPILKRLGFLSSDGTPTEIYSRFKTDSGRPSAALHALKNGFGEVFKRSEYAHSADDSKLHDIVVEITGLPKSDQVVSAIRGTFKILKGYIPPGVQPVYEAEQARAESPEDIRQEFEEKEVRRNRGGNGINLAYNINIVLPETSDLTVLNAIFRSVKENLLK
jgi:hypothetical protein